MVDELLGLGLLLMLIALIFADEVRTKKARELVGAIALVGIVCAVIGGCLK